MATEVWVRNPSNYIREALEAGATSFAWDRGFLMKRRMDPLKFVDTHIGVNPIGQRSIVIGVQGTGEYGPGQTLSSRPLAVYPTWAYGQSFDDLLKMIQYPAGLEPDRYKRDDPNLCAVAGQEHRVVVVDLPNGRTGLGQRFLRQLAELQVDNPECILHVHGLYGFRPMFALGFRAVDIDPRSTAQKGKVMMPHGKEMSYERAADQPKWISLLGMRPSDLRVPRNRCIFNILSAGWAGKHFRDNVRWSVNKNNNEFVDPDDPINEIATDSRIMLHNGVKPNAGDQWLCNSCSIQLSCKFFREGAVCTVPDSEPLELAHFFKTTDSETIIEGLGTLLAAQTHRLNRSLELENEHNDISPETTKIINTLFDRAVKLAKLVDPRLAAAGAMRINIDNRTATINASSPQQLMAAVVQELVSRGVRREDITPEMVMAILEKPEDVRGRAIEAAAGGTTP